MSPLQIQWDRIRRRWVLILVIGIIAAAGSLGASVLQGTTYTGRAALTIVSQDRAPEQDTVLAQGYADYFNQSASQQELRGRAGIESDVTLNARIAAASPIVYVEATSDDPQAAQDAATRMAVALRDDVNEGVGGDNTQAREQLERDLAAARGRADNSAISRIEGDLRELDSGGTNELRDLQLTAGVAANSTNAVRNAGAALGGGLLFGVLLAAALGRFENRIVTPNEVRDRLGVQVLAVVNGGRRRGDKGKDTRSELLRSLMGLTDAYGMPSPGTLAITGPNSTRATKSKVAVAIAGLRALQGQQTLLLQTDLDGERTAQELADLAGVADFLAERGGARIDGKVFSNGCALLVGPPGRRRDDVFALYSKPHMQRLLQQGVALADLVIVDAPPVDTVEGQIVCGAADRSLLVVEEGETRARDASNAQDALQRVGATALGVVLVRNAGQLGDTGFLSEGPWNPVALPPPPGKPAPSGAAVQYQPANRTQPITREKLDEARAAAAARESGAKPAPAGVNGSHTNGAAVATATALAGGSGPSNPSTPAPGTSAPAGPATPAPSGGAAGRGDAPTPAPGASGPPSGPSPSGGAPSGPVNTTKGGAATPAPGKPSPAKPGPNQPTPGKPAPNQPANGQGGNNQGGNNQGGNGQPGNGQGGAGPVNGQGTKGPAGVGPQGKAPSAPGAPGSGVQGGSGSQGGSGAPGKPSPQGQQPGNGNGNGKATGNGAAAGARPGPAPQGGASNGPASPASGPKAPGSTGPGAPGATGPGTTGPGGAPSSTGGGDTAGGPNVRRPSPGARPSPRPKPSPGASAPSGPSASGATPSGSAPAGGTSSPGTAPRATSAGPPGAKRIGTARFVDGASAGSGNGTQNGAANGNGGKDHQGTNGTNGGGGLAAPTVTMRPDK